jgi:hypothetical protein
MILKKHLLEFGLTAESIDIPMCYGEACCLAGYGPKLLLKTDGSHNRLAEKKAPLDLSPGACSLVKI